MRWINIYHEIGVNTFINAVDSETILGGSLMPDSVIQAMNKASKHFVKIEDLEMKASEQIAEMTNNEACFITNSAAAGIVIAVAACITGEDLYKRDQLPFIQDLDKNEVIVHRRQRHGFDFAIKQTGAKIVEIGNFLEVKSYELERSINERTACVFYFAGSIFEEKALPLEEVIKIAHRYDVPVIVDAAAQLPPVDNLWNYTEMGADMVIFSGGKTLRGPQASGFILGKEKYIRACRINASPHYSIGRPMKISKEEIVGLLYAVKRYMKLDHEKERHFFENTIASIVNNVNSDNVKIKRLFPGPIGQEYPRAAIYFNSLKEAERIHHLLKQGEPSIQTTLSTSDFSIIINPLHLVEEEVNMIVNQLNILLKAL